MGFVVYLSRSELQAHYFSPIIYFTIGNFISSARSILDVLLFFIISDILFCFDTIMAMIKTETHNICYVKSKETMIHTMRKLVAKMKQLNVKQKIQKWNYIAIIICPRTCSIENATIFDK